MGVARRSSPPPRRVVTEFEIGAHILTAGWPLHIQAMQPLRAAKFKLTHYPSALTVVCDAEIDTPLSAGYNGAA
jgi:hypothetical protein